MPLPHLSSRQPAFAFLVHPRSASDLHRFGGTSLLRDRARDEAEFISLAQAFPPVVGAEIVFGFTPIRGELIGLLRLPEAVLRLAQQDDAIVRAVRLAVDRGARVVGLGALIAPASNAGQDLVRHVPTGVTVTTGNAYTAAVLHRNTLDAAATCGLPTTTRVAVVGCTGSVGAGASELLAECDFELILIGRTIERVETVLGHLAGRAVLTGDLSEVAGADIVLVTTSASSARLAPSMLKAGAVVIDAAQPSNVPAHALDGFAARRIQVATGGLVTIPGYRCSYDFGFDTPETTFACLAETYLFAKEGITGHSVGRSTVDQAQRLERIALRHGVRPQRLQCLRPVDLSGRDTAGVT